MNRLLLSAISLVALTQGALAVETGVWSRSSRGEFIGGEFENVVLRSDGVLALGSAASALEANELSLWCMAVDARGTVYVGSGTGVIYRLQGESLVEIGKTGETLVTCFAPAADGGLLAGTLPNGKIFHVSASGVLSTFAAVPAKYVWTICPLLDGTILVGCGPGGEIFKVNAEGKSEPYYDTDREHVLSLVTAPGGGVYAGTAGPGILYHLSDAARPSVLADFGEGEVRAIVVEEDGGLVCAVNGGMKTAPQDFLKALGEAADKSGRKSPPPSGDKGGGGVVQGRLVRVAKPPAGHVRDFVVFDQTYITDLKRDAAGTLLVSTNNSGKVFGVTPRGVTSLLHDFKPNQVLALLLVDGVLRMAATGDIGTLQRIEAAPAPSGHYTSEVFDAKFASQWGSVKWEGNGSVSVRTRSGNTSKPDSTWSDWSAPVAGSPVKVTAPAGRYLQFRLEWAGDLKAAVRSVEASYLVRNQAPKMGDIQINPGTGIQPPLQPPPPRPVLSPEFVPPAHLPYLHLRWQANDPDGDELVYRASYRAVDGSVWMPLAPEATPLRVNEIVWNTEAVADGRYLLRVEASDERRNPAGDECRDERTTEPFVIDNTRPAFPLFAASPDGLCTGRAEDVSRLLQIDYSVDGGDWKVVTPNDGVCDGTSEEFSFRLPGLAPGGHTATVRAVDEAGNIGVARQEWTVPGP